MFHNILMIRSCLIGAAVDSDCASDGRGGGSKEGGACGSKGEC